MDQATQLRRDFYQRHFGNEFEDYYLGHRSRSLLQKLGRLIRRPDDKGAIIVVDGRVKRWKNRTMDKFLQMLSPYEIKRTELSSATEQIQSFFD